MPALVAFMVLATVGVSLAGSGSFATHPNAKVSVSDGPRAGHRDDDGPGGEVGSSVTDAESEDVTSPDEAAGCEAALEAGDTALEVELGLDRAVQAILENCARGGHVQGLLNALAHLQGNQERQGSTEHGTGPNENANENANGPGGHADPANFEVAPGHGPPDEPGRSSSHANGNAASH